MCLYTQTKEPTFTITHSHLYLIWWTIWDSNMMRKLQGKESSIWNGKGRVIMPLSRYYRSKCVFFTISWECDAERMVPTSPKIVDGWWVREKGVLQSQPMH